MGHRWAVKLLAKEAVKAGILSSFQSFFVNLPIEYIDSKLLINRMEGGVGFQIS